MVKCQLCVMDVRKDTINRHFHKHIRQCIRDAPVDRLQYLSTNKNPIMYAYDAVKTTEVIWAYCLVCNKGAFKHLHQHTPKEWMNTHMKSSCMSKFETVEHLFYNAAVNETIESPINNGVDAKVFNAMRKERDAFRRECESLRAEINTLKEKEHTYSLDDNESAKRYCALLDDHKKMVDELETAKEDIEENKGAINSLTEKRNAAVKSLDDVRDYNVKLQSDIKELTYRILNSGLSFENAYDRLVNLCMNTLRLYEDED